MVESLVAIDGMPFLKPRCSRLSGFGLTELRQLRVERLGRGIVEPFSQQHAGPRRARGLLRLREHGHGRFVSAPWERA